MSCSSDPAIFDTGFNAATKGILANGSADANWTVAGGYDGLNYPTGTTPPDAVSLPPAGTVFLPGEVGRVNIGWAPSPYGNSQWISADYPGVGVPGQNQGIVLGVSYSAGDWYYEYQFNLDPSVLPSSFSLAMKWLADNDVAAVFVNGVQQRGTDLPQNTTDPYQYLGYHLVHAAATTLAGSWLTGLNTIIVQMKSGSPAEGFDAQVQQKSVCPTLAVSKTVAKRARPADQFTVAAADSSGTVLTSATTTGAQTRVTSARAYIGTGSTYTITDAMAAGSPDPLADYLPTIRCTDTTTGKTVTTSGAAPAWRLTAASPDAYACAITNTLVKASLSIAKTASPKAVTHAGQLITYSFRVTNTGDVTLTHVAVTDKQAAPAGPLTSGPTCPTATLEPGAHETCTATYTVTQADIDNGRVRDSATAGGVPPHGPPVTSPPARATVPATRAGALTVVKSTSTPTFTAAGQVISYSFLVTNTGNVTLTHVAVTDTQAAPAGPLTSGPTCPTATLAPGASETCTATYTVTQADIDNGKVSDTATASGNPPSGSRLTSPPSTLTIYELGPPAPVPPIVGTPVPVTG